MKRLMFIFCFVFCSVAVAQVQLDSSCNQLENTFKEMKDSKKKKKAETDYQNCKDGIQKIKQRLALDESIDVDDDALLKEVNLMIAHIDNIAGYDKMLELFFSHDELFTEESEIDREKLKNLVETNRSDAEKASVASFEKFISRNSLRDVQSEKLTLTNKQDFSKVLYASFIVENELCKSLTDEITEGMPASDSLKEAKSNCKEQIKSTLLKDKKKEELGQIAINLIGPQLALNQMERYLVNIKGYEPYVVDAESNRFQGLDPRSGCIRSSIHTADFFACKNVINLKSAGMIGGQASDVADGVIGRIDQMGIQQQLQDDRANNVDPTKSALNAQETTFEKNRNRAIASSSVHTAAVGTLTAALAKYPTVGQFSSRCKSYEGQGRESGAAAGNHPYYCYMLSRLPGQTRQMFSNSQVKNAAWQQVGLQGGKALTEALKAYLYNDMKQQVGGVKDAYDGALAKVEEVTVGFQDCQTNPEVCPQIGEGQTTTFEPGNFSFGGGGSANLAYENLDDSLGDVDDGLGVSKTIANRLGKSLTPAQKKTDLSFKKIGAGGLKQASTSGGGGGGGGAAGGGGGGGSSAGPGKGAGGSSTPGGSYGVRKAKWSSGKSYSGGKSRSNKKKAGNSYAGLFKNKPNRGLASGAKDIAPKTSALFGKISDRYKKLDASNRLKK